VKPQSSAYDPRVVGGADIQMRKDVAEQYLAYKLIDSNQDWKSKWFYVTNHHPGLPKPSGKQPKHRPWWNTKMTMQEGIQLPELLVKIKALREVLTVKIRQPSHEFNFGVGMSFILYPLVLTPVV
jgi:hypothetical protein